ncbi:MAG TPA: hypothetical protein VMR14_09725 [Streptosporangiaceae bacterium]|nr:hypothetical protein [Streptosporangiaceae bacterium]
MIDADVFDDQFGDAVAENSEGTTVFGDDGSADGSIRRGSRSGG